jgi:adenosylcobinamide-GDP ribazoletransferase
MSLRRVELASAFMLLTRLPVGWIAGERAADRLAEAAWAFPLVGVVIGGIGGAVYWGCAALRMPPAVATVWTLAAMLLVTGALHEDGLADSADGIGGGRTLERKLEIMRDSRIGVFGAIALMLSLAARGTALAVLTDPERVTVALIVAAALGRGAIAVLLLVLRPARVDGMASRLGSCPPGATAAAVGIAAVVCFALLSPSTALEVSLAAMATALGVAWLAYRQVGGYTGDLLGAASVVTECVVLGLLSGMDG